jgi:phenylpropionate dioxygenase-like ring-hydroxylating dioxygenase large terminal subunit
MPQTSTYVDFPGGIQARVKDRARLDTDPYTSDDFVKLEWDRIWRKSWLFAGLESDLAKPGAYFLYELGRESIVVTRNEEGRISAFFNVCQHRGNRIFSTERGTVRQISCPYHGWTYDLNGKLKRVPDVERFRQGVPSDQRSLKPVVVETWAGLVWINMNPDAAPLDTFLGVIKENLAPYHIENMVLVKHQTVTIDANWKTAKDNFLEQYHVDFIHPQHASFVDCCNSENELWPFGHSGTMVEGCVTNSRYPIPEEVPDILKARLQGVGLDPEDFRGRVSEIRKAVQKQKRVVGKELGYDYSEFTDDQVSDVWQYDFFPNLFMTIHPEELWIYGPRPHASDPNKCFFDKWTLQIPAEVACDKERGLFLGADPTLMRPAVAKRPGHEIFTQEDVNAGRHSMTITVDQDIFHLPHMQAGMHSQGFDYAWLNEDEARVQHFHDWLDVWMSGDPLQASDPRR